MKWISSGQGTGSSSFLEKGGAAPVLMFCRSKPLRCLDSRKGRSASSVEQGAKFGNDGLVSGPQFDWRVIGKIAERSGMFW